MDRSHPLPGLQLLVRRGDNGRCGGGTAAVVALAQLALLDGGGGSTAAVVALAQVALLGAGGVSALGVPRGVVGSFRI